MKIPVSELEGERLAYWVAKARGWSKHGLSWWTVSIDGFPMKIYGLNQYRPDINGEQALELVKEFEMDLSFKGSITWKALFIGRNKFGEGEVIKITGQTPEIAICRAVVAAKFGEYVEEEE